MGTTGSRGKKVAPALMKDVNVCDRERSHNNGDEGSLFNTLKCKTSDGNITSKRTQIDPNGDRQDWDFSAYENLGKEVDRRLETCESTSPRSTKGPFHNSFFRSKIFGLCYSKYDQSASKTSRTVSVFQSGGQRVDPLEVVGLQGKKDVCCQNKPATVDSHKKKIVAVGGTGPVCTKTVSVAGICSHPSLVVPALYDASEEDLMDMIEREFS